MNNGTRSLGRLVVAVDLLPLRPGGENGGIKPALFTVLQALGQEAQDSLVFAFITNSAALTQVRTLLRGNDLLICGLEEPECPIGGLRLNDQCEFALVPLPIDLVRRTGADILYCPFGATTLHCPGIPTVALIADLLHRDYPYTLTSSQIAERESYLEQTIRVASKLQCISRSGMESVMQHYGVAFEKLFFTYLPVHVRLAKVRSEGKPTGRLFAGRPFFFYPANLWVHKNHETLLVGYQHYRSRAKEEVCDLVLTFQTEKSIDRLKATADALGLSEFVHFAGYVEEHSLDAIWQNARALVFPSLHEGFGIPLLEAMQYDVPIICGDDFSLGEVAGDACYRIDARKPSSLAEGMLRVGHDGNVRAELVKRGRERLLLFDLRSTARTLLREMRSAVQCPEEFPRMPNYLREAPSLITPTPVSRDRWTIELTFAETATEENFELYLDDLPFGTASSGPGASNPVSFSCRPDGRYLSLRRGLTPATEGLSCLNYENPILCVTASKDEDASILLYERR